MDHRVHHIGELPSAVTAVAQQVGWLENRSLAEVLLTAAVALAAGWTVVAVRARRAGRRPGHRLPRRLGLGTLVTLLTLTGTGIAVNSYVGYAPDVTALVHQAPGLIGIRTAGGPGILNVYATPRHGRYSGRLVNFLLADPEDRIPAGRTWVYLPAGYDAPQNAARRYPVVYLIHGYPSASYDWFGAGGAATIAALMQQDGLAQPMIIVAPDASAGTLRDTECLDSSTGGPRLETFLTGTLARTIDARYRTVATRAGRAIGGLSAGGYCAVNLGLRHQQEYGVVLGMEPYGDPGRNAVRNMLGGDLALGTANSPMDYIAKMSLRARQRVFLAAAANDPETRIIAHELADRLAARGVYVATSFATSLGHDWREGRVELPYALEFASAGLTATPTHDAAGTGPGARPGPTAPATGPATRRPGQPVPVS